MSPKKVKEYPWTQKFYIQGYTTLSAISHYNNNLFLHFCQFSSYMFCCHAVSHKFSIANFSLFSVL